MERGRHQGLGAAERWDTGGGTGPTQERPMDYPVSRKVMTLFAAFAKQQPGVQPRPVSGDNSALRRAVSELTDPEANALPDELWDMLRRGQHGHPPPAVLHPAVLLAAVLTLKDQKRLLDLTSAEITGISDFVIARRPPRRKTVPKTGHGARRRTGVKASERELLESFLRGYVGLCPHCGEQAEADGTRCRKCGSPYESRSRM